MLDSLGPKVSFPDENALIIASRGIEMTVVGGKLHLGDIGRMSAVFLVLGLGDHARESEQTHVTELIGHRDQLLAVRPTSRTDVLSLQFRIDSLDGPPIDLSISGPVCVKRSFASPPKR